MTQPDEAERKRLIEEANAALADLSGERIRVLAQRCLPNYRRANDRSAGAIDVPAALLEYLTTGIDGQHFRGSERTDELDDAVHRFTIELSLFRKKLDRRFDVFLAHSTHDKPEVRSLAAMLRRNGLLPWLDEEQIFGGSDWLSQLNADLPHVPCTAVVIGPGRPGPWQGQECDAALQLFVEARRPVIPVVLPSRREDIELPLLMKKFCVVDFRRLDPDPYLALVTAVRRAGQAV